MLRGGEIMKVCILLLETIRVILMLKITATAIRIVAKDKDANFLQDNWFRAGMLAAYNVVLALINIPLLAAYMSSVGKKLSGSVIIADLSIALVTLVLCFMAFFKQVRK